MLRSSRSARRWSARPGTGRRAPRGQRPTRRSTGCWIGSRPPQVADEKAVSKRERAKLKDILGPGLITGASDDDPSGIATYSQAGAGYGFALGWTLILT